MDPVWIISKMAILRKILDQDSMLAGLLEKEMVKITHVQREKTIFKLEKRFAQIKLAITDVLHLKTVYGIGMTNMVLATLTPGIMDSIMHVIMLRREQCAHQAN